jgi:hypothetical protein
MITAARLMWSQMRFCLLRRKPFGVHQRICERDLQLDLLATQRRRCWQGRDLVEGARELLGGFD